MKQSEFLTRITALERAAVMANGLFDDFRKQVSGRVTGYTGDESDTPDRFLMEKSTDEKVIRMQKANDDVYILSKVLGVSPKSTRMYRRLMGSELGKAMAAATTGAGADWVPTGFSRQLIDLVRISLKVAATFDSIPMPTNPFKLPVVSSDATAYLIPEETSDTGTKIAVSTAATANSQLTAKKLACRTLFSEELNEDSIIPVLPWLKKNLVRALGDGLESGILNGDTSGTHMDSDVTAATDVRKAYEGLRYLALTIVGASVGLGTFNIANVRLIRQAMAKYGVDPDRLAWIAGPKVYNRMMGLADVVTVDKYGPKAVVLTGELAKLDGIPVLVSGQARENLNASGVYDGTTTSKAVLLLVNRDCFMLGDRRKVTVKTDEDIETDQTIMVATQRMAFRRNFALSQVMVACGYNIAV